MSLDLWKGEHRKDKKSPSSKALVFRISLCSPLHGKACIFIFVSFQQHNYVSIFFHINYIFHFYWAFIGTKHPTSLKASQFIETSTSH